MHRLTKKNCKPARARPPGLQRRRQATAAGRHAGYHTPGGAIPIVATPPPPASQPFQFMQDHFATGAGEYRAHNFLLIFFLMFILEINADAAVNCSCMMGFPLLPAIHLDEPASNLGGRYRTQVCDAGHLHAQRQRNPAERQKPCKTRELRRKNLVFLAPPYPPGRHAGHARWCAWVLVARPRPLRCLG